MRSPGAIAFPVILVLGAITGYLTYEWFHAAIPEVGFVESPYRVDHVPEEDQGEDTDGSEQVDESQFENKVTVNILMGAAVQGNPDYDPDVSTAGIDSLITWVNEDDAPHTATSGTGFDDADSGSLFDSSIINAGESFSIAAEEIGAGEHAYYCAVHPYMTSMITIQ